MASSWMLRHSPTVVNTPHNPVAKVFTKDELLKIAALAEQHNLLIMADEVVRYINPPRELHSKLRCSMMSSYLTGMNMFASQTFQECGIVRSQSFLQ